MSAGVMLCMFSAVGADGEDASGCLKSSRSFNSVSLFCTSGVAWALKLSCCNDSRFYTAVLGDRTEICYVKEGCSTN